MEQCSELNSAASDKSSTSFLEQHEEHGHHQHHKTNMIRDLSESHSSTSTKSSVTDHTTNKQLKQQDTSWLQMEGAADNKLQKQLELEKATCWAGEGKAGWSRTKRWAGGVALEEKAEQLALISKYSPSSWPTCRTELRPPLDRLLILSDQLSERTADGNLTQHVRLGFAQTIHSVRLRPARR